MDNLTRLNSNPLESILQEMNLPGYVSLKTNGYEKGLNTDEGVVWFGKKITLPDGSDPVILRAYAPVRLSFKMDSLKTAQDSVLGILMSVDDANAYCLQQVSNYESEIDANLSLFKIERNRQVPVFTTVPVPQFKEYAFAS